MQSHLIEVLIKSGIPFCQTKTLSSWSCAKVPRFPTKHHHGLPSDPSSSSPLPREHARLEEGEPIRVDWHFVQLAAFVSPSPTASVLIGVHKKVGARWIVDLAHCCRWRDEGESSWPDIHESFQWSVSEKKHVNVIEWISVIDYITL